MITLPLLHRLQSFPAVRGWAYTLRGGLYLGLTNRTNSEATFLSARGPSFTMPEDSGFEMAIGEEPQAEKLAALINEAYTKMDDLGSMGENDPGVAFAGAGDPLLRLDVLLETIDLLKALRNGIAFRVKTWGLVDSAVTQQLIRAMSPGDEDRRRETRLAKVSVCLPCSNPLQYAELVGPTNGKSFGDVCSFVAELSEAGIAVECTAVSRPDVDVEAIRKLAISLGADSFRVMPYFP